MDQTSGPTCAALIFYSGQPDALQSPTSRTQRPKSSPLRHRQLLLNKIILFGVIASIFHEFTDSCFHLLKSW